MTRLTEHARAVDAAWTDAWRSRRFRAHAIALPILLTATFALLEHVLPWVERRPGAPLADPLLALLPPLDLTWLTFTLIYAGLLVALVRVAEHPRAAVVGLEAYALMLLLRMGTMYLTPLGAPAGMIALRDPFAESFTHTSLLTKDLFFSGHTSTMFLLVLGVPGRAIKWLFLGCTIVVGGALLWQHVHYTIDVVAAPPFAWLAYRIASRLHSTPTTSSDALSPTPETRAEQPAEATLP